MSNDSIADQLATDITLIKGRNPGIYTLSGTNCYLIGSGASRILIDSGQGIKVMEMEFTRYLDDLKITISDLLITHRHHDHVGGIPFLKKLFPSLKVWMWPDSNEVVDGAYSIQDGQEWLVDESIIIKAIYTPGHTNDHCCFSLSRLLVKDQLTLFTGDCILGQGSCIFDDLEALMESLEKIKSLKPSRLYCGHGPVVTDAMKKIEEYIRHRKDRDEQLLTLLNEKESDADGLVQRIYQGYPEPVLKGALKVVELHLMKLKKQGFISRKEGIYRINSENQAL